jgi:hypothetical protein
MSPRTVIDHRDYRIEVWPYQTGYQVLIWPPASAKSLEHIPFSRNKSGLNKLIARAKSVIDEHIKDISRGP